MAGSKSARARQAREIVALIERYGLPDGAGPKLDSLLVLIARDPLAPTTIRDRSRAVDDHLSDSLVALEFEAARSAIAVADLGAGAGFPGLPLAIARPLAQFTLVESSARKCAFIERAVQACALSNVTVMHTRAETWPEGLDRFDLITARALAPLPVVAEYAAPLLRVGGALLVWRGRRDGAEELVGVRAAAALGLEAHQSTRVHPYAGAQHRHMQLMVKVSPTPAGFPRRPGMASKRPLGGL